jgi:hypothetical protein
VQAALVLAWSADDRETMDTIQQITDLHAQVAQMNEAERVLLREQLQPAFLDELRHSPDDPAAQWVLRIYDNAHTPLAEGSPPLTRQMSDAYLELLVFTLSDSAGQPYVEPEQELKDAWAQALAADYGSLDPDMQQALGQMPSYWAAVRLVWPTLSDDEKAQLRTEWLPLAAGMVGGGDAQAATAEPVGDVADEPQADTADQSGTDSTDQAQPEQPTQDQQFAEPPADTQAATQPASPSSDYWQAYQKLQQERQTTAMVSNMLAMQHDTSMSVINNIGSSNYTYQYQWVYTPAYP